MMVFQQDTPMPDVIAGMAAVLPRACHEFARRQISGGHGVVLYRASELLHESAFSAQLDRPAELVAWKYPESFEPIDSGLLMQVLNAASDGDATAVMQTLANADFATITALSSIATHLKQSCEQLQHYGVAQDDDQGTLFGE